MVMMFSVKTSTYRKSLTSICGYGLVWFSKSPRMPRKDAFHAFD